MCARPTGFGCGPLRPTQIPPAEQRKLLKYAAAAWAFYARLLEPNTTHPAMHFMWGRDADRAPPPLMVDDKPLVANNRGETEISGCHAVGDILIDDEQIREHGKAHPDDRGVLTAPALHDCWRRLVLAHEVAHACSYYATDSGGNRSWRLTETFRAKQYEPLREAVAQYMLWEWLKVSNQPNELSLLEQYYIVQGPPESAYECAPVISRVLERFSVTLDELRRGHEVSAAAKYLNVK